MPTWIVALLPGAIVIWSSLIATLNWPPFLFSYALLFIEAFDSSPIRRVSPTVAGCPELQGQDNHYNYIVIAFVLKMKFLQRRGHYFVYSVTRFYSSNKKALFRELLYNGVGVINVRPNISSPVGLQIIGSLVCRQAHKMDFSIRILSPFPTVGARHLRQPASLTHTDSSEPCPISFSPGVSAIHRRGE